MPTVYYIGTSTRRTIRTSDFVAAGVNDQTTVTWDARGDAEVVSAAASTFLLAQADFDDEAPENPAVVTSSPNLLKELNLADLPNIVQARRNLGARAWPLVGTMAARPAASSTYQGDLYLATDVNGGTLYYCNGTTWTQVGAGSTEASGAILGTAILGTSLTSTGFGTPSVGLDMGLAVTVNGTGRPVTIEWGGQMILSLNGQASGSLVKGMIDLVDQAVNPAGLPNNTVLDTLQISGRLTGDTYYTPYKQYVDLNLPVGTTRTYNLRLRLGTGGGAVAGSFGAFGTNLASHWAMIARQG